MKKENSFGYVKPETEVIEMEMESAILEVSGGEQIQDSQMEQFGDSWTIWK